MPKFYAEILRGVGQRDDNWKPLASNDPAVGTIGWVKDGGVTANSDGDILSLSGTTAANGISKALGGSSLDTNQYTRFVLRGKADAARSIDVLLTFTVGTQTITFNLTTEYQTVSKATTAGKVLTDIKFLNQSSAGVNSLDYEAVCQLDPLQISKISLSSFKIIRISYGADVLTCRLDNRNGKYVVSGQNPVGFGDHVRIWAGSTSLNRVFGGYVEWRNPERNPSDEIWFTARSWGVALHEILVLREYLASTPRTVINSIIDNDVNASGTNYQITRSFVQDKGTSIAYLPFELKPAWECFREISDLIVAQGTDKVSMFVDASENLHLVPMSITPNWGTDPFPASYPTTLSLKVNQILNAFQKDVLNLRNRVHYFAVAQSPGDGDDWTENGTFSSTWGVERKQAGDTITISAETTTVKIGAKSVKFLYDNADGSGTFEGAVFYPSGANLALNVASLGTKKAPPLFDVYWRIVSQNNVAGSTVNKPTNLFFATDASNRFEYNLTSDNGGTYPQQRSILNTLGVAGLTTAVWYHITLPIGPYADEYVQTPNVGSPSWSNINYMGIYYQAFIGGTPPSNATFLIDGMRVIGGRYRIAYDNRASPPLKERREISIFDPLSKDETTIKNLAKAELLRLRDPVLRGTVTTPILGDLVPEQTLTVNAASADLTNAKLRAVRIIHNLSQRGFITEIELSDDYVNAQTLERFRLANALLKTGHPGVKDREIYDLRLAQLDPTFAVTPSGGDPYT